MPSTAVDYRAVHPEGTLHPRKPAAQEIAAAPIDRYSLTQLPAVPIGHDGALVTHVAEGMVSSGGSAVTVKFAVGEVWSRQAGEWKCRHYRATILM
jgi:hypothetical protein